MSRILRSLAAVAALALPATLAAQEVPAPAGVALPVAKNNVLSIQPLSAVLTVYAAEYERKLGETTTLGVGATHWSLGGDSDEITYTSADVKWRYYPGARVFQGFSFGAQAGFTRITEELEFDFEESDERSASGPSFGFAIDYNWLLGPSRSFYVGLGVGAKAVFVDTDEFEDDDVIARYPTARISVGYAF